MEVEPEAMHLLDKYYIHRPHLCLFWGRVPFIVQAKLKFTM